MTDIAKLTLTPKSGNLTPLVLPFNPESLSFSQGADYTEEKSNDNDSASERQYLGRKARTLSVSARLDSRAMSRTVPAVVDQILSWLDPTAESVSLKAPSSPLLGLSWGAAWFTAVLKEVRVDYSLFSSAGTPLRATVGMELLEVHERLERQNPTSGSVVGRRAHLVVAGDTLPSIATALLGDPRHWRDLALANGVDDPLSVSPGTRLLVPDVTELAPLSAASLALPTW